MSPEDAQDEVLVLLKTAWDAGAPAAAGTSSPPEILWPNRYGGSGMDRPDVTGPWARVSFQHTGGDQCTLGGPGSRRFERTGYLTVQVFVPLGEGVTRGLRLAKVALDSFEGQSTPGGVWFRKCRIYHVGRTRDIAMNGRERLSNPDPWEQIQAIGEFTYFDTK